jgi:hypothetical protein
MTTPEGLQRLEAALRAILGNEFEDQIRALVGAKAWCSEELPGREVFRLWVQDNLEAREDPLWVFQPIRASERKFLCTHLGIPLEEISGLSPRQVAELILLASGLPGSHIEGTQRILTNWRVRIERIAQHEDERAAVWLRQAAERFLRRDIYFYCSTGHAPLLLQVLRTPDSLKVPKVLEQVLSREDHEAIPALEAILLKDGWADLGFLALALRKLSARIQEAGVRHLNGKQLVLFTPGEHEAFNSLASALQSYAHDNPSKLPTRRQELLAATTSLAGQLENMIGRSVVPDELIVLETTLTVLGSCFRGLTDSGKTRTLSAATLPTLGGRILFIASTTRDYAGCQWTNSPWPAHSD